MLPPGKPEPDILALLPFTWGLSAVPILIHNRLCAGVVPGNGLPASAHEVYLIEKAQARREAEAALPPVSDERSFNMVCACCATPRANGSAIALLPLHAS